ncbi:MAG: DUF354 domain-containing protein [Methanoregula sp.]|jgi:hypothetical protein|uniref:DUF354 domain-containing protein n=1 Tax=Methanoregula sp. TaxID=2052170 RepID=UPI003D145860
MKILVGMMHPKHVYMFKNFIQEMTEQGHEVEIVAIEKDLTLTLLKKFQIPFKLIGNNPTSTFGKLSSLPQWTYQTYKIARRFKPDIFIGQAFPHFAYVSALQKKPYIIFEDSEPAHVVQAITFPFATYIVTPSCYREDLGNKHIKFKGYFELAYLHPNNFSPSRSVLEELKLQEGEKFIVLRFVSWNAIHDIGQNGGFDLNTKIRLVNELTKYCKVFITSEGYLPPELEKYRITISPEKIHDLLFFAQMIVGDSQTMTTEAGVLGTPAIRCNSFVGINDMGNFLDLEKNYTLIYNYTDSQEAINKAIELIQRSDLKKEWRIKREKLIDETIDFTQFMVNFVERFNDKVRSSKGEKK